MQEEHGFTTLDADELRGFMAERAEKDYTVLDVRQPQEYAAGHIPGARHLPLPDLEAALAGLEPGQDYVFYCHSGRRSRAGARMAVENGRFTGRIYNLDTGITGWNGLAVPEMPRIAVFSGITAAKDQLMKALELEKAALALYTRIHDASKDAEVAKLMQGLMNMEQGHARSVYAQLEIEVGGANLPGFDQLFKELDARVLEGGMTLDELGPWVDAALSGSGMDAAELALEIEYTAYDLYRAMAHQMDREKARTIFLSLAQEEKKHARMIIGRLDAFTD